jgi:hypothetical protein
MNCQREKLEEFVLYVEFPITKHFSDRTAPREPVLDQRNGFKLPMPHIPSIQRHVLSYKERNVRTVNEWKQ